MGLFGKLKASFRSDWCASCGCQMQVRHRQLYMLPMTVGHYSSHQEADYYRKNLRKVARKADIPTGVYACGAVMYQCPECGQRAVQLQIFLPVRDQEKYEDTVWFLKGELDDFLWRQK